MENVIEQLPKPILIEDLGRLYTREGSKYKARLGIYKCGFCGNEFKAQINNIKYGTTKSCGCYKKQLLKEDGRSRKHKIVNIGLYTVWGSIKGRTLNPKHKKFNYYGGRGISICESWKNDFMSFHDWAMENGYEEHLTIDRIDNNGSYEPDNCRWTTQTIQCRNQRVRKNNTSGYKGCSFVRGLKKYRAYIKVDVKQKHLGLYPTAEDGAVAYNNYIIANDLEGFPLNKLPDSHIHLQLPTKPYHQTLE